MGSDCFSSWSLHIFTFIMTIRRLSVGAKFEFSCITESRFYCYPVFYIYLFLSEAFPLVCARFRRCHSNVALLESTLYDPFSSGAVLVRQSGFRSFTCHFLHFSVSGELLGQSWRDWYPARERLMTCRTAVNLCLFDSESNGKNGYPEINVK